MNTFSSKNPYVVITAFYALSLPEYNMHQHRHPRCEIMYVTKGSCFIYVNQKEVCLEERQFIFLNANIPHQLFIPEGSPCSLLNLEFLCQEAKTAIDLEELFRESPAFAGFCNAQKEYFAGNDTGNLGYSLKDLIAQLGNSVPYKNNVRNLTAEFTRDQSYLIRLLFFRTLLELSKCFSDNTKATGMLYLKKACSYISSHLTEEIRIPQLAAYAGINKSYLQSLFSKYMQCTITDYVNRKRLEQAAFLLINSSLSITDIAFQSGYNSRQHFGNTFEKYYGTSPRSYRQLHGKTMEPSTGSDYYYVGDDGNWTNITIKKTPENRIR